MDTRKVVQAEAQGQASGDVKSALRGMHAFDLLGRWGGARTQLRIAGEPDIPKSSLTQVLKTPLRHDDVAFDAQTRAFSLGPAIRDLASLRHRTSAPGPDSRPGPPWIEPERKDA